MSNPPVICFGEILWDFLPDGLFPGGAPFNVGYHLHRHRVPTHVVSAVGADPLGDELLRRLTLWGLAADGVARHHHLPTGFVRATVGPGGDAHYEIVRGVAWDEIVVSPATLDRAAGACALIFGSLAQRTPANRSALSQLQAAMPPAAWRVFDVNLRPPFDDLALVRELARSSTLLKLNNDEAARLVGEPAAPGREEGHARSIAADTGCPFVVVTAGERGAGLLRAGAWHWEAGRRVAVVDTVGAGDAFLAALVTHLLGGARPDADALARACRIGEWVAGRRGATPAYDTTSPTGLLSS